MRVLINTHSDYVSRSRSFLCWSRNILFVIGVLALGYCAYVKADAFIYQSWQERKFEEAIRRPEPAVPMQEVAQASIPVDVLPVKDARPNAVNRSRVGDPDVVLGKIQIGKAGLSVMLVEGVDDLSLRRAVGHVPNSAMPGEPGNMAIAGHRDTYFRTLRSIEKNDEITVTTLNGSFHYLVDFSEVVEPSATEVLDPSTDATLTLLTCYPFSYIGSAPKRLIVRAHMVSE